MYEKQGRRTEAMNAYRMAASHKSLERRSAGPPEKDEPRELLLKLASKESLAMDLREAAAELQRTRTTKLALMPALRQTGDVYFLFGDDGKVKDIAFSKGDESLAAPDEMEKIRTAGFRATLPGRSEGIRIVRRGSIFCGRNLAKCDAVLYEVSDVRSVNY